MPTYIKTDTDEALLKAIELSTESNNIHSVTTYPVEDSNIVLLQQQGGLLSDYEVAPSLPWEDDNGKSCSLTTIENGEELTGEIHRANGSHDLQQFGNLITNTKETNISQKAIHVMSKIMSCAAFVALGHRRD